MNMRIRFLHLGNDFWFRAMFVPFMGLLVTYISLMVPEDYVHTSFITQSPSLFTLPVVFFIFECNRSYLLYCNSIFIKNYDNYSFILLKRIFFQLVISAFLMLFFLNIWYVSILALDNFSNMLYNNILFGLSVTLAIVLFYEAGFLLDKLIQEMTKSHLLEMENVKSQTNLLRSQLAPHFMFNSLSTLMSLIEIDKQKAIDFLSTFSNSYRYILSHGNDVTVKLEEELSFVKDFFLFLNLIMVNTH